MLELQLIHTNQITMVIGHKFTLGSTFFLVVSLSLLIGISACGNEKSETKKEARQKIEQQTQQAPQPNNQMQPANTQLNNSTSSQQVFHYTCPNGCEGTGSNAQGKCSNCGTALVHNQAFHQQQQPQNSPPAQNAQGEYHYVCSAGCAAGAATQGTCPECGAQLTHNQAYHQ